MKLHKPNRRKQSTNFIIEGKNCVGPTKKYVLLLRT